MLWWYVRRRAPFCYARPEHVLTTQEAEVLQKAEAGVLPCPRCGQTLRAEMIVSGDYEGVVLSCPDRGSCGFREC